MKAIFFNEHGGLDVLQYGELPTPEPKAGEVLVRLRAAALNRLDLWVRAGWPGLKLDLPHIPGADGAGQIAALGPPLPEGEGFEVRVGDPVVINANIGCGTCDQCLKGQDNLCRNWHLLGETMRGTYAEYIAIHQRQLLKLPAGFDFHTAAAASLVFQTAWHSLVTRGKLQAGEDVLIVGASGGVNTASIVIAKHIGARVLVVGAGEEKLALAQSLGADVLIDRTQEEDWSKAVFKLTERRGVDVVVDNVGTTFPLSFKALSKGGRLLTVGNTGDPKFEIDNRYIFSKHLSVIGSTMGTRKDFSEVMSLVTAGKLRVARDRAYPLEQAATAQARLTKSEQLGKITLDIA